LRVPRVGGDPAALAAGGDLPVAAAEAAAAEGLEAQRRVVLLRAVDPPREARVGGDAVDLRGRLVLERRPLRAAVEGDAGAAVVALDHAARVVRVDPEVVVVAVRDADRDERPAAVVAAEEADVQHPEAVALLRVGEDARKVPGALGEL